MNKKNMRWFGLIATLSAAIPTAGQTGWNDYARRDSTVCYQGQVLAGADLATFTELGFGYGKDKFNVYYRGEVLEFVNPNTFEVDAKYTRRHKIGDKRTAAFGGTGNGRAPQNGNNAQAKIPPAVLTTLGLGTTVSGEYTVAAGGVRYEGQPVKGADAASFEPLKAGYAKDKHHAYYMGHVIRGALGGEHFQYTHDDYATDGLHTYFKGREVIRD